MSSEASITNERSDDKGMNLDEEQLVVFKLSKEEFGIKIEKVREIVRIPEITHLPKAPEFLCGISNLRGDIMPIIDTRKRFSMPDGVVSERSRVLVVDVEGRNSGLVVDEVTEVMRVHQDAIDSPPFTVKGVDHTFLEGIVKTKNGKRVIMTLNLKEVIPSKSDKKSSSNLVPASGSVSKLENEGTIDEEQIISLEIGDEEYGFPISDVREILRNSDVTEVPNVPPYVKGLITVRNNLLPILDMRTLLGKEEWIEEISRSIEAKREEHEAWVYELEKLLDGGPAFASTLNPEDCELGRWLKSADSLCLAMPDVFKQLKSTHKQLHETAERVLELSKTALDSAQGHLRENILPTKNAICQILQKIIENIEHFLRDEQRILVIETGGMPIGLLVDTVNEVLRVPRNIIDDAPAVGPRRTRDLLGVAKLDNGKRLIMILNQSSVISREDMEVLQEIEKEKKGTVKEEKTAEALGVDEEQFVTFYLGTEEFAIRIMEVQEINRFSEITRMPKAPKFVEGVTNLRGDVVPVIDLRKRLGMKVVEKDDHTRIIIVDLDGRKTGLVVDGVNEVMRLPITDIEKTEGMVSGMIDTEFIDGIGKIEDDKRVVILLKVENILSSKEKRVLAKMGVKENDEAKERRGRGTKKKTARKKQQKPKKKKTSGTLS